jgi:hypothetical protein
MKKITKILMVTSILTFTGLLSQGFAKDKQVAPIEKMLAQVEKSFKKAGGSAEGIEVIKSAYKNVGGQSADIHNQVQKIRDDVEKISVADKFDVKAYENKVNEMQKLTQSIVADWRKAEITILSNLSKADREILLKVRKEKKNALLM